MKSPHPTRHPLAAPRRLSLAVHSACMALAITTTITLVPAQSALAAEAAAITTAARYYSIAAGPLGTALSVFATEAGISVSYPPALVEGLKTDGLRGQYAAHEGLARLLAGTGLEAAPKGLGLFVLRKLPSSSAVLPEVKVSASAEHDGTTEGTGSYTTRVTGTATKLGLSLRETPQTVSVVTRQQMDDFAATTVDDALKATSGVFVYNSGGNGNEYYSRGFRMQAQYDGILNPIGISGSNRNPMIDSAFLDRIEVLQGASGLLSGAGDPGGVINLVRKRATREFQSSAEVQLGSWNKRRVVGDVSGSLVESGAIRGRIVALLDDSDSFINHVYNDKQGFYGVIEADLSTTTTLSASVQYQKDKGNIHLGVPFAPDGSDLRLSRSTFIGNANSQAIKEYKTYTVSVEQKLQSDWVAKASYVRGNTDVNSAIDTYAWGNIDVATGNGLTLYQARSLKRQFDSDSFDVYASGPVTLFDRKHELVFGANGTEMRDASQNSGSIGTPINIYNFDPTSLPTPGLGSAFGDKNKTVQRGAFAVGRFSLADSLKLIAGSRVSWYEYKTGGVSIQKEDAVISPYAGLIYDLDKQYSLYASYSDIFKPQSELGSNGSPIKPIVGVNQELGIKGELLGGKLNVTTAIFRLEQSNLAKADTSIPFDPSNACKGTCYTAADKITSEGADFSINGELAEGWNVVAGYTYVASEYATGAQKGQRYMTSLPQHSLRAATYYKLPGTSWSVGGNMRIQSAIHQAATGYRIEQGGYAIFGLGAKYQISKQADLLLAVDNVFDRRYWASTDSIWWSMYGEPRRASATLKYRF